jgi:hypothetical protein
MSFIRIEPRKDFDKAIHKQNREGYITYDYWKLVEVCMRLHKEPMEDAIEWVEYNILGLNDSVETYFGVHYPRVRTKVRKVGKGVGKVRKARRR